MTDLSKTISRLTFVRLYLSNTCIPDCRRLSPPQPCPSVAPTLQITLPLFFEIQTSQHRKNLINMEIGQSIQNALSAAPSTSIFVLLILTKQRYLRQIDSDLRNYSIAGLRAMSFYSCGNSKTHLGPNCGYEAVQIDIIMATKEISSAEVQV